MNKIIWYFYVMAPRREQLLWENVWPITERLEQFFSLKAVLSAGVLLFDSLTGDEQKRIIAKAHYGEMTSQILAGRYTTEGQSVIYDKNYKKKLQSIKQKAQNDPDLSDSEKHLVEQTLELLLSHAQYIREQEKEESVKSG